MRSLRWVAAGIAVAMFAVPASAQTGAVTVASATEYYVGQAEMAARRSCIGVGFECEPPAAFALGISFATGATTLTAAARASLDALATTLNDERLAGFNFTVFGHTDSSGPADLNLSISAQRARAVVAYLVSRGVAAGRLDAQACGETRLLPGIPSTSPQNRRIEVRFQGQVQEACQPA